MAELVVDTAARAQDAREAEAADPGLTIRPIRRPDDYPEMNRIANAERERLGIPFTTTPEQLANTYDHATRFQPDRDVIVVEVDGRIRGYARGGINPIAGGGTVYEILPFIDPVIPTARLLPPMLSVLEAHLRRLAANDAARIALETFGGDATPDRDEVIRAAGFEPVRHAYQMVRPYVDDVPDAELPEGLEIRPVRPEDVRKIWDASVEAFRDEWAAVEPAASDFEHLLSDENESQTSLWRVAWDGDEVVGQVRGYINAEENARTGRRRGYTEAISVRRPWRRRGVARALIAATIVALRERGMTEVALGVDTENESGALHLYESCGYRPVSRFTTFRKPFD